MTADAKRSGAGGQYASPSRPEDLPSVTSRCSSSSRSSGRRTRLESIEEDEAQELPCRPVPYQVPAALPVRLPPDTTATLDDAADETLVMKVSTLMTQVHISSYLILFAFLGTLARLGLQALTHYPGTPVSFASLWPNFVGTLVMGFLVEDSNLFQHERAPRVQTIPTVQDTGPRGALDHQAAKDAHNTAKRSIPLYIGLTTGFCGSFTSFSSFIRDILLAILDADDYSTFAAAGSFQDEVLLAVSPELSMPKKIGYAFMSAIAVIIITLTLCLSALYLGCHLAQLLAPCTPSLPRKKFHAYLNGFVIVLAWGFWLGIIILNGLFLGEQERGSYHRLHATLLALLFAPLGCLFRFYLSLALNGLTPRFPWGTFTANIIGTLILGISYDLQRSPLESAITCQVLQGLQDGLCGCLTTVSTWITELTSLSKRPAYIYGIASVIASLGILIMIMGSMFWTSGYEELLC